jgi:SAM-dependent methyltransferase
VSNRAQQFWGWVQRGARYLSQNIDAKAKTDLAVFNYINDELGRHLGTMNGRTVLDVGCGPRYQLALLFQSFGSKGVGIDLDLVGPTLVFPTKYGQLWCHDGLQRALQVLVRDVLGRDRAYYRALEKAAGVPLRFDQVDVRCMSVSDMTFPDATFNATVSTTVFEHVADVPRAVHELARVLKDDGVIYMVVHLYTSLSGGHHPAWSNTERYGVPTNVPPWDHLRENRFPSPVYLNKLRLQNYLNMFGKRFEILDLKHELEGEQILTPELEKELAQFSREELLCRYLHIIGRKRSG